MIDFKDTILLNRVEKGKRNKLRCELCGELIEKNSLYSCFERGPGVTMDTHVECYEQTIRPDEDVAFVRFHKKGERP